MAIAIVTSADSLTIPDGFSAAQTLVGNGVSDVILLNNGGGTFLVASIQTLIGGTGFDSVTLVDGGNTMLAGNLEVLAGGADSDLILLTDGGNTTTIGAVEILVGGAGADLVSLGDDGNTILLRALETLTGGAGLDAVTLGDTGATMVVGGLEVLIGGAGTNIITLADTGNTLAVSAIQTLNGGGGVDVVTVTGGNLWFQTGVNGGDQLTLAADPGTGPDMVGFNTPTANPSQIVNFQPGLDHLVLNGLLRGLVDHDNDGVARTATRASGTIDALSDEVVVLQSTVTSLNDDGFASVRAGIGPLANSGFATSVAVLASDGVDTALYALSDGNADGQIGADEIHMLGVFKNARLTDADILYG